MEVLVSSSFKYTAHGLASATTQLDSLFRLQGISLGWRIYGLSCARISQMMDDGWLNDWHLARRSAFSFGVELGRTGTVICH